MTRCRLHSDGAITAHVHRNWLLRLLGFDDIDMEVEYSGGWYCNADTGMLVDGRTQRAIERELAKLSASRRPDLRFKQ